MDTEQIIELLECAKINIENIKKGGVVFCEISKMQIDNAIEILNADKGGSHDRP